LSEYGEKFMAYLTQYGDLTQCRIGSGVLEYEPPLDDDSMRLNALRYENLETTSGGAPLRVKDAGRDGVLDLGMSTSYVYLTGTLELRTPLGGGTTSSEKTGDVRATSGMASKRVKKTGSTDLDSFGNGAFPCDLTRRTSA
jgi:hypothetical protein